MTTTADWVAATRRHAQGGAREPVNVLAADMTGSDVSLTFPVVGITTGMPVEIDWVLYLVVAVDTAQRRLTVVPDDEQATTTVHPAGSRVRVRPRFPSAVVVAALNSDLDDLSAPGTGLYQAVALTRSGTVWDVPDDAQRVVDAATGTTLLPLSSLRLVQTGAAVRLDGADAADRVLVSTPFGHLSGDPKEDVHAASALPFTALDLPPLGAAIRLLEGSEGQRNVHDAQGETRRAEEVPPGALATSATVLRRQRQQRIQAEAGRLQQRFGWRF